MRNVIFVAPFPLETTYRFVRAASSLHDVRLLGIVTEPAQGSDQALFHDVIRVDDALDANQLIEAGRQLRRRYGRIHRVLGILEPLQVQLGELREALGVDGATASVADVFRDKARMKDVLREHGFACARHRVVTCHADAASFAEEVGFPIVLKPTAGMGCRATWRIDRPEQLRDAIAAVQPSAQTPTLAEEFLVGREYSFETITVGGAVQFQSATRYLPTPLEVMENPWIQWTVLHPREITGPEFDDARDIGVRAVSALGLDTGFTHMEWFRRRDGSLAIGEIAARPPGAQIVSCNNYVHDADLHRAWARAVVDDAFDGPWERKYAVGCAFLRGMGRGRVVRVTGVAEANAAVGGLVVESRLPRPGAHRSDSYEGDGFVIVRHPNTDVVAEALRKIVSTIRVHYG